MLLNLPVCVIGIVTRPWAGHRQFLGLEAQQSLPCSAEVKNVWSYTYILTYAHMACIERNLCVCFTLVD